jgi:NodT family efflux transporter outer membrane factor (OMF) lipoprotein
MTQTIGGHAARWAPAVVLLLAGCTVGPDYHRPSAPVPTHYKEAAGPVTPGAPARVMRQPAAGQAGARPATWHPAQPQDAAPRGAWWSVYRDPVLDGLERQVDISNQTLKQAAASFRHAEAIVAGARAGFFPTLSLTGSGQRSRSGGGAFSSGAGGAVGAGRGRSASISNFFAATTSASWEPDLWGKIRRNVESSVAAAQASAADLADARLSAQGQVATDYLELRVADELKRLLDTTVAAYTDALRITRNQYKAGIAAQSDVSQAQAQLDSTRAQAIAVVQTRGQLEHAIAVLTGKPPAELSIAPVAGLDPVPAIPVGVPSTLLQRRPDIAAAERTMAAANAEIGVAIAAYYPDITLSADYGFEALALGPLFEASNKVWSFGTDLAETAFDGGARAATVAEARATYDADVAGYRQTVLTAFQQVEDQLVALRVLAQQRQAADSAVAAANEAERTILNQYRAGTVAYTNVIVAQATALGDAETALNVREDELTASVALIEALGGGWDATQLPGRPRIERDSPLDFSPLPPAK